ncbi:hypothetical protein [Ethanoligenens harbinense]|uniref:hypothetical protein n=1 Tax=Ethanoligenens harbinense TaxID=253239 RepID=UPI00131DCE08|nr:hypothetical protein [Ethanoligenens harbinense]
MPGLPLLNVVCCCCSAHVLSYIVGSRRFRLPFGHAAPYAGVLILLAAYGALSLLWRRTWIIPGTYTYQALGVAAVLCMAGRSGSAGSFSVFWMCSRSAMSLQSVWHL